MNDSGAEIGRAFAFPDFRLRGDELPYINPSFSVGGEDLVLRKLLKSKLRKRQIGFYVDIGAASTVLGSNSYLFYCYGWRGVCVDANPAAEGPFKKVRPRDKFINCAVGQPDPAFFFPSATGNAGMSRVSNSESPPTENLLPPTRIKGMKLADLLADALSPGLEIDFMSIDVEGSERDVIGSNDWTRFRPNIVLMEDANFKIDNYSEAVKILLSAGYAIIGWQAGSVWLKNEASI